MEVVEGVAESGEKILFQVDEEERSIKAVTKEGEVEMERLVSIEGQLEVKDMGPISFRKREEGEAIAGIVENKALVTRDSITRAIRRNVLMSNSYDLLDREEEELFYKVNGERIRRGLELSAKKERNMIFVKEVREEEQMGFVLNNKILLSLYFSMAQSFEQFTKSFFGGYVFTGDKKNINDVDMGIARERRKSMGTEAPGEISELSRINIQSFLMQKSHRMEAEEEERVENKMEKEVFNSGIIMSLVEDSGSLGPPRGRCNVEIPYPLPLSIRNLRVGRLKELQRVEVNKRTLHRLREISKLVYRHREKRTEGITRTVERVVAMFREEIRRTHSPAEVRLIEEVVKRILPTSYYS